MWYAGNGIARIYGDLQLYLGSNVTIFDNTGFVGLKVLDKPKLYVGDNTYIAPRVRIMVGEEIRIGSYCTIGSTLITDNSGHPTDDVLKRMRSGAGSPAPETIKPVQIGDFCFLAVGTFVYPGVSIGDGVVATLGTHIIRDIPPFCQVSGNPAKIIKKLPIPEDLVNIVGRDRYNTYLEAYDSIEVA
jgi:acetyltransferase-like isoleucine patch superfamily enzyme